VFAGDARAIKKLQVASPCDVRPTTHAPYNLEQSFITSGEQVKCSSKQRTPNLREILATVKCPWLIHLIFVAQILGKTGLLFVTPTGAQRAAPLTQHSPPQSGENFDGVLSCAVLHIVTSCRDSRQNTVLGFKRKGPLRQL